MGEGGRGGGGVRVINAGVTQCESVACIAFW